MLELKQKITLKTYRGHIRNHAELCKELDISPLLSREDMEKEIIIKAYEKWGYNLADHIYGMFSLALFD